MWKIIQQIENMKMLYTNFMAGVSDDISSKNVGLLHITCLSSVKFDRGYFLFDVSIEITIPIFFFAPLIKMSTFNSNTSGV